MNDQLGDATLDVVKELVVLRLRDRQADIGLTARAGEHLGVGPFEVISVLTDLVVSQLEKFGREMTGGDPRIEALEDFWQRWSYTFTASTPRPTLSIVKESE